MVLYEKERDEKEFYLPKENVLFILAIVGEGDGWERIIFR